MEAPEDNHVSPESGDYPKWFWAFVLAGGLIVVLLPIVYLLIGKAQAGPRERLNAEACLHNLREIGLAASIYIEDHGTLPPAKKWTDALTPYLQRKTGGMALLKCPSFDSSHGYAMQSAFGGRKPGEINHPDRALLFFDSTLGRPNASDALESFPVLQRHLGRGNAAFADGHVKTLKHREVQAFVVPALHAGP